MCVHECMCMCVGARVCVHLCTRVVYLCGCVCLCVWVSDGCAGVSDGCVDVCLMAVWVCVHVLGDGRQAASCSFEVQGWHIEQMVPTLICFALRPSFLSNPAGSLIGCHY